MSKVLITPVPLIGGQGAYANVLRSAGLELVFPSITRLLRAEEVIALLPGVSAVLCSSEPYSRAVLDAAPALRVIARAGVGHDAVDVAAATEKGIAVTITPGSNHEAVAELTFALLLAVTKRLTANHNEIKAGAWPRRPTLPLRGKTLGILGLGRIGKAVALRGRAFGMRILACDISPDYEFALRHGIPFVPLERLLGDTDFLTLHVPLTRETRHLINRRTLPLMKPTAFLINTARGGVVCEADLLQALRTHRISGAGLDVFEVEPPESNPLFELDNVVMSPHVGGIDVQAMSDMAVSAAHAIVDLSQGKWPAEKIVNPEIRDRFHWK